MMSKRVAALAVALMAVSSQAFGWMAVAVDDRNNTFVSRAHASEEEAKQGALDGCARNGWKCTIDGTGNRTSIVIAKGSGGHGWSMDPDPANAARKARASCAKVATACKVVQALWDSGADLWLAVAQHPNTGFYAVRNSATQEAAEAGVLALCRKNVPEGVAAGCALFPKGSLQGEYFIVLASSSDNEGLSVAANAARAQRDAIAECMKGPGKDLACKVISAEKNAGQAAPPAGLQTIVDRIERDEAVRGAVQQSRTTSRQVLTCTNQCFNGQCIRTFQNGRKERWTAPRVYNPTNQNWEWDTSTNACGT